ncbi:putative stress-induced transcription regulator [Prauserella rugosa]|uniref:Putative stress-induced transcription regulator n=1 Tax=Prauserella rugosa TaxID=43354 RepID=A0A660CA41_9PSEU|nr:putative stress-induced transcription regulator [Prauserella rugosa]
MPHLTPYPLPHPKRNGFASTRRYYVGVGPFNVIGRAADLIVVLQEAPTVEDVTAVLVEHGEREPFRLTAADVEALREAAPQLREVFAAASVDEAVTRINALLARYASPPRLTSHGGVHPWHLHADRDDDGPLVDWFMSSTGLAMAFALAERQRPPGGICASESCRRPFADPGGGSPRRYCSPRCATRERVAAHRRAPRDARRP